MIRNLLSENRNIGLPVRQTEIELTKEEYSVTLNL